MRSHCVVVCDPEPALSSQPGNKMTNPGGTPVGWYYAPDDPQGTQCCGK